jgi:hypothetical protein
MYYYVGFAYMMMRRYADAIRTFCNILLYIQRTRGLFQVRIGSRPPQFWADIFHSFLK